MASATCVGRPIPFQRILVTGAGGFVGRHLVPTLASRLVTGARIVLATRFPAVGGDYEQIAFDLTNAADVDAAIQAVRPDLVIHLAAQSSVGQSLGTAAETWAINVCGSLALARAITRAVPNCTVLQISSAETYGLTFNREVATEASLLQPQSVYARSKAAAEAMFADVLPASVRLIVARPSNHSGPGQDERFVIPDFAAQIARIERGGAKQISVGNLDAERDFLDVRDVVAAYVALLTTAPSMPARNTFNVSSGQTVRIGDILVRLMAMSSIDIAVNHDLRRMRASEVPRAAISSNAIYNIAGWLPIYNLESMLADVLTEWRGKLETSA